MRHQIDDPLACTCLNLRKATRAITQLYDEALRPLGLRATQFSLLSYVEDMVSVPITKLAAEVVMDRTTLTRNLRVLEDDGLIRVETGADARVREVSLTAAGRAMLARALPVWTEAQRAVTKRLGPARFDRLLDDLAVTVVIAQE